MQAYFCHEESSSQHRGESNSKWYGEVELNIGYNHKKIQRLRWNSVQEKSKAYITAFVDTDYLSVCRLNIAKASKAAYDWTSPWLKTIHSLKWIRLTFIEIQTLECSQMLNVDVNLKCGQSH